MSTTAEVPREANDCAGVPRWWGKFLRWIKGGLACQMRGSTTRRKEDTPKILSSLRREKKVRRTTVVSICPRFLATVDTTMTFIVANAEKAR